MPTLDQVKQQISVLKNVDMFGTKKEVAHLPEVMLEDEVVKGLSSGLMDGNTWLVVCTNKRIIFLDKGLLWGLKKVETPLEKVNSIECKTGLIFGEVAIWDGSSKMVIKNMIKTSVNPFVNAVNTELDKIRKSHAGNNHPSPAVDVADQIKKLASLKADGVLTEEEFLAQKKKLLAA